MKNISKLLVIIMLVITSAAVFAQGPPDPNGDGSAPNGDNTPVGGRATVSGGIILLLALGAGYGGKKVYDMRKKKELISE
jgi:hypothetical protein